MSKIEKIISGGQTGVDRAALDVALELKIKIGGYCPKGRIAEDGMIPDKYPLIETNSVQYEERTELNVQNSDGTLIISQMNLFGGSKYTLNCVKKHSKPVLIMMSPNREEFCKWIETNNIHVLNIAGPREENVPAIYEQAKSILKKLLS